MKSLLRFGVMLVFAAAVLALPFAPLAGTASADTFNPNKIIDDAIFDNSNSMNAGQIDAWLNGNFPNSCISSNSGFAARVPSGYSPSGGFTYGGFVSAGGVIATAAQVYGVNPQALLVTLQKEQSLVAGGAGYCNNGDEHKYAAAAGYGCPDGGTVYNWSGVSLYMRNGVEHTSTGSTCVNTASKAGFSQQVIRAAWLLKFGEQRSKGNVGWAVVTGSWNNSDDPATCYGGPMTQGTFQRCSGGASTFYDGYTTIDGTPVHMESGATAALYWYTPHFHGNQNFFDLFTGWFGPTNGTALLKGSSPTIYVRGNDPNVLYGVPSGAILQAYGLQNVGVTPVSDAYINSLNTSSTLTTLFLKPGDGTIFLADHGHMSGIASGAVCDQWALPCNQANLVATLPSYITNPLVVDHPLGNLMLNNNTLFLMTGGTKRPFIGNGDLNASPYAGQDPTGIQSPFNSSQTAGPPALYTSQFFQVGSSGVIYYYSQPQNQYFAFTSFDNFKNWWNGSPVPTDWFSSFNTSPPSAATVSDFVVNSGTNYLVSGSTAFALPGTPPSTTPVSTATYPGLATLLQGKSTVTINSSSAIRVPSGTIFALVSNELRPFATMTDLNLYAPSQVYNLPATITNGYPVGKFEIPAGRLVKISGGATISLYGDDQYLWGVSTAGQVNASLTWANNVLETGAGNVSSLGNKSYVSLVKMGSTYYAIQANGSARPLPAATLSSSKDTLSMPLSGPIANRMVFDLKGVVFIHLDNGPIYAVDGSTIRPISQFSTYRSMGGVEANTLELPAAALPAFNVGSPL